MAKIINEQELMCEIQDSVQGLIDFVKGQVKSGKSGHGEGDADSTERGIFKQFLGLGLQLMCLYFSGLGDGDAGEIVEKDGVQYKREGRSPGSLLTIFGVVRFKRFLYYRLDGVKESSLKLLVASQLGDLGKI